MRLNSERAVWISFILAINDFKGSSISSLIERGVMLSRGAFGSFLIVFNFSIIFAFVINACRAHIRITTY